MRKTKQTMKIYKIGLIGCGRIGTLLEEDKLRGKPCTHAGGFNALSNAKLVAGCDIDSFRLKKFGTRWGVDHLYEDYQEMLHQEKLDVVCIATWTNLHAQMVTTMAISLIFCLGRWFSNVSPTLIPSNSKSLTSSVLAMDEEKRIKNRIINFFIKSIISSN